MNKEKRYIIRCSKCKNNQKTIVRADDPFGRSRKCVYCGETITITRDTLMGLVR